MICPMWNILGRDRYTALRMEHSNLLPMFPFMARCGSHHAQDADLPPVFEEHQGVDAGQRDRGYERAHGENPGG